MAEAIHAVPRQGRVLERIRARRVENRCAGFPPYNLVLASFAGMARSHEAVTLSFLSVHRNAGGVGFLHRTVVAEDRQSKKLFR